MGARLRSLSNNICAFLSLFVVIHAAALPAAAGDVHARDRPQLESDDPGPLGWTSQFKRSLDTRLVQEMDNPR